MTIQLLQLCNSFHFEVLHDSCLLSQSAFIVFPRSAFVVFDLEAFATISLFLPCLTARSIPESTSIMSSEPRIRASCRNRAASSLGARQGGNVQFHPGKKKRHKPNASGGFHDWSEELLVQKNKPKKNVLLIGMVIRTLAVIASSIFMIDYTPLGFLEKISNKPLE